MSTSLFERTRLTLGCSNVPDPDMFIFFEKGMGGGVSYICNRYSKTNNKYLKSNDPKQKSKHIVYLYANDLYGYAISKFADFTIFLL